MYCIHCGKKVNENANFCTQCGEKIEHNASYCNKDFSNTSSIRNGETKNLEVISLVIGIISILGGLIFNIFMIPVAITGIILGLQGNKKLNIGVILNIIAIILIIVIIIVFVFIFMNFINSNDYINEIHDIITPNYDIQENTQDEIEGTWYLYEDGTLNNNYYISFNDDNAYTLVDEDNVYVGNYSIEYGIEQVNGEKKYIDSDGYIYYYVVLTPTYLRKNDGNIERYNLSKTELAIAVKNDDMKVTNIKTNASINLKKEALEIY